MSLHIPTQIWDLQLGEILQTKLSSSTWVTSRLIALLVGGEYLQIYRSAHNSRTDIVSMLKLPYFQCHKVGRDNFCKLLVAKLDLFLSVGVYSLNILLYQKLWHFIYIDFMHGLKINKIWSGILINFRMLQWSCIK